ncbi:hypothetical protein [Salinibacterium sp. GXW1014]|uniref:hypothetical protein n=1 Tax=Salinibacterium sp. GXW1014 TaxID=3377838 RepID=UPI00383ACBAF
MLAGGALPAHAASGNLEVSADGTSYSKNFTGVLFDALGAVVPGDEQLESFWLRNSGDEAGYLRVTLEGVTFDDLDFANALTLQATVGGSQGPRSAVSLAQPCWVLNEGTVLQPGQAIRVDTLLHFGNLDGMLGQGATATAALAAALSDTRPGSLAPTSCGGSDVSIGVVGAPGRSPAASGQSIGLPSTTLPATDGPQASGDLPVLNLPGGIVIDPNTWQLFEEYLVLILVGAMAAGGFVFLLGKRRRTDEDPGAPVEAGGAP